MNLLKMLLKMHKYIRHRPSKFKKIIRIYPLIACEGLMRWLWRLGLAFWFVSPFVLSFIVLFTYCLVMYIVIVCDFFSNVILQHWNSQYNHNLYQYIGPTYLKNVVIFGNEQSVTLCVRIIMKKNLYVERLFTSISLNDIIKIMK